VIVAREVGGAADEVVAVVGHKCWAVGVWRVRTFSSSVDPFGNFVDRFRFSPRTFGTEGVSSAGEDSITMWDLKKLK
jgi:hypothetical protein